jgi:hypothetical protein
MRARHGLATAATLAGGLALAMATAVPAPALSLAARTVPAPRAAAASRELIYVANADSGPVTAYPADTSGAAAPALTVLAPKDPNAVWDPWSVTFDSSGHLFVQTFLSDATGFVFRPGAHGVTKPVRDFRGIGPDSRSIAVDSHGYEYVVGSDSGTTVVVEPPGASGQPGNLYYVKPVRTFQLDEQWRPWPGDLAVDSHNDLLAEVSRPQGNGIEVYAGGAHGSNKPIRVITGPATGLGSCGRVCDVSIAFSSFTGDIYAAVSDGTKTHISVFAGSATGNAKPLATIEGPATGLAGTSITGVTSSQCDGTIYAMVHTSASGFGPGRVYAFARSATGDASPLRWFTDRHSRFRNARGLTVTNCPSPGHGDPR